MKVKPNEICFLNYINGLGHSNNLPDYWKYSYGINPNKVTKKLIELGFLEFRLNIERNISNLKIPHLKELLKSNNLPLKGNKNDLIARIFENIDLSYLEKQFPEKSYCLTSSGKNLIENNYLFIINQKENYCFEEADIIKIYQMYSNKDNKEKLIELFNFVIQKDLLLKEYTDLELRIWQFYNFYLKVDLYNEALFFFIVDFKLKLFNFRTISNEILLDDVSYITFSEHFIDKLKNIVSLTEASFTYLKNIIDTEQITVHLPFKYFSNDECYKILLDLLDNKFFNIKNYQINKPARNNPNYTYYGYNDAELLNLQETTNKKSNNLIIDIFNSFFSKGKH